jgi:hypothetical protein
MSEQLSDKPENRLTYVSLAKCLHFIKDTELDQQLLEL